MRHTLRNGILRRFTSFTLLLLLLFGILPVTVLADTGSRQTVRVGFFEMDGYHMRDEDGALSGYGYDFLQLVARYSNLSFEYVGYDKSWEEMQKMLADGELDLLTSVQKTPEREKLFDFSDNLIGTSTAILTVKAGDTRYSDGDYDGMRIGLIRGNSRNDQLSEFMDKHGFKYTSVFFDSMHSLTNALQDGTDIDAAMTSTLRWTKNEWTLEELDPSPFYAVVKKGDTELLNAINNAINLMDSDSAGWRTRLLNKYYTMDSGEVVAFTGDERDYLASLKKSGKVLIATMNPDAAPYSYFVNGEAKGIIPDIFAEVAARMGIDYRIKQPSDREEYRELCTSNSVDIILDGIDDFYTVEINGLEISDVYYTTPLAVLTAKSNTYDIKSLAQPSSSLLNEKHFSAVFGDKDVAAEYKALSDIYNSVKSGSTDGSYMPYYCAQWLSSDDVTGRLKCLMLPKYDRAFVYAVSSSQDYRLLSSLNKTLRSLSEDYIASVVAADTEYSDKGFSLIGFVYKNPVLSACIAVFLVILIILIMFLIDRSSRARKELRRSRKLERYIGYLCDMYYKVLEVDFELQKRKQYMKRNGIVEIEVRDNFSSFDIDSVHPDDSLASLTFFSAESVRELAKSGVDERYLESRMKNDDGEYHWFSFLLKLIPQDNEHPCSVMLLIKDIDELHRERERNHEALVNALDAANAASRSKSTFLSSMSHEIRTPLNAMIGYMTIASTSIDNRDKVIHCIDSAGVAARHLLSIINDVLDISSMESGKMKLSSERFDLKEQLSGISALFYQQCKQKNIKFIISVNCLTEEWVIGDSMRVNQILMNLMSNAVKFTGEAGSVNLTVAQTTLSAEQVFIRFIVKDTGIGMSEEYLSRLFSPFEQESAQTARKYGGTGLGMSITFNLVKLMGGTIDVTSKQNEGTTFTVTLPFGRTENKETRAMSKDISRLRVLVVDDMENECDYISALMLRCGVRSEAARSVEEALRLVSERKNTPEKFDLCIIDWNMPGLNGVETTRLIHKECDPDMPIIIATAYDISEFEEDALAAGATKIISKPLFQSTLFDLLVTTYGKYDVVTDNEETIPVLDGMRVLLAEDNEMNIEVARDILELAGIGVDVAHDGRETVDKFISDGDSYDVILMDVQMPVMDGYEATRLIRASEHPKAKNIPIIAMTANAFAEDVSASLSAGMNGHLSKPIETPQLFNTLKRIYRG